MGSGVTKAINLRKTTYVCEKINEDTVVKEGAANAVGTKENCIELSKQNDEITENFMPSEATQSESDVSYVKDKRALATGNVLAVDTFKVKKLQTLHRKSVSNATLNSEDFTTFELKNETAPFAQQKPPEFLTKQRFSFSTEMPDVMIPCKKNLNMVAQEPKNLPEKWSVFPLRKQKLQQHQIDKAEWREITLRQQTNINHVTHEEKDGDSSRYLGKPARNVVLPHSQPAMRLSPISLPNTGKNTDSYSDEDDFIDTLDWDLGKEDEDYVSRGAKKYLGYAAMGKLAKQIKKEEDALMARAKTLELQANDDEVSQSSSSKIEPVVEKSCCPQFNPEDSKSPKALSPCGDVVNITLGRDAKTTGNHEIGDIETGANSNIVETIKKTAHESNIQAEIMNKLGQVEKLIFDLELL